MLDRLSFLFTFYGSFSLIGWSRHCAWTTLSVHSDSIGSRMDARLDVTCHLHVSQNHRGLLLAFTYHCGNTGVERTPDKSQHRQLTLENKFLPPLLPGLELATFRSRVRRSTNRVIPASWSEAERLFQPNIYFNICISPLVRTFC